ncbi:glucosaminidase domain-containing protein [Thiovibrio sp. JS02]
MDCLTSSSPKEKNTLAPGSDKGGRGNEPLIFFGRRSVDPDMVRMVCGVSLAVLFFIIAQLKPSVSLLIGFGHRQQELPSVEVHSATELVTQLKTNRLWEVEPFTPVNPVLVKSLPADFPYLDVETQKRAFLHTLLPVAMIALSEVQDERYALEEILSRLARIPKRFAFGIDSGEEANLDGLRPNEVYFLQQLCQKYRTNDVDLLLRRVNLVPVSLILAQGALESSWGGSRFALEGNNLFGVWTWGIEGIIPSQREEGKEHKVASYATLLDSVRAYILMLNRVAAYSHLRSLREQNMDSLTLANGLRYYSERREEYVADLARVIRSNQLQMYDECVLASRQRGVRLVSLANMQ